MTRRIWNPPTVSRMSLSRPGRSAAALAASVLLIAGAVAMARTLSRPERAALTASGYAGPSVSLILPQMVRSISPEAALAINQAIPFNTGQNPPAEPFQFRGEKDDRANALECLSAAVVYEAASEGEEGQRAVAQVVLNRVRNEAYPSTVCGVVFQGAPRSTGCQFTFTCDGSLVRTVSRRDWERARAVANAALSGSIYAPVGLSTHYHANYVVPYWADELSKTAQVGLHIFYRLPNAAGQPVAFKQRYSTHEGRFEVLRAAAMMSMSRWTDWPSEHPTQQVEFTTHPAVELLRVVAILGKTQIDAADFYEREVRARFASSAEHPAVNLLKAFLSRKADLAALMVDAASHSSNKDATSFRLSDSDDQTAELAASLADFAQASDFQTFFTEHQAVYRKDAKLAQRHASDSALDWSAYTGAMIPRHRFVMLPREAFVGCRESAGEPPQTGAGDDALAIALAQFNSLPMVLSMKGAKVRRPSDSAEGTCVTYALVRSVLARIAVMSRDSGRTPFSLTAERDKTLLTGLHFYETHRAAYRDLAAFWPALRSYLDSRDSGVEHASPIVRAGAGCPPVEDYSTASCPIESL